MLMRRKLNRVGFSLAETLLAILILLLVATVVATGVPAAKNAYYKVILGSNAQSLLSTTATALRDELGTAWNVQEDGTMALTYFKADTGNKARLELSDNKIMITDYASADALKLDGMSTGTQRTLLPAAAISDNMYITYTELSYDAAIHCVVFNDLTVFSKDGKELSSVDKIAIRVLSAGTDTISGMNSDSNDDPALIGG